MNDPREELAEARRAYRIADIAWRRVLSENRDLFVTRLLALERMQEAARRVYGEEGVRAVSIDASDSPL